MRPSKGWQLAFGSVIAFVLAHPAALAQKARPQKQQPPASGPATGQPASGEPKAGEPKGEDEEEMTFEPDEAKSKVKVQPPPPDNKAASKTLAHAIELYEKKKDYNNASIELSKVLNKETEDSEASKQKAEFFMGKTLYQMGYYAAALAYFDRIVAKRTGHRWYSATLKWLAALSRVLPETSGILEKIGTYDPKDLEQPIMDEVRDELYYLLGRHFYRQGSFEQAIGLFQRVKVESPFYVKAKFFEGVTYVRQYRGAPAVDAFKQILVIGQEKPGYYTSDDILTYEELANLQLARVFYSTQQYDVSIKYFEKLPQESPDWLESLFEASWGYFMRTNNSKALGNIHTLNAPYFENEFFPGMAEAMLLKAVIYYKYCQYDRALESVAEYNQSYAPLREDLDQILGKYEDNAEFYDYVVKIQNGRAGLGERTQRVAASSLTDRQLAKTFAWVQELDKELKMLEKADRGWAATRVRNEVEQELTVQKSLAQADAGKLARERLKRMSDELRELSRDGRKIRIETLNNKAGQIDAKARGEQISSDHRQEPIVVDDEHFLWKFNGEYWKDELGFYRFKIRSRCPAGGAGI
ncbi:MAG TPA: tetratricopeptide repeat protein [Kofleriaceae bacterium]|nr:tetratricopeptide repeat protein [Kofleriaceae bacterium]